MTKAEAREVLIRYNTWRRYDGPLEQTPLQPEPKEIGEAIDVAIEVLPQEETEDASLDEAARRVLNNWLDGTDCPDVSGDFTEFEYAIREYDGDEKQKEQKPIECIEFANEFEKQVSHLLASVLNGEWEYNEGFVKHAAQSLLGYAKNELKPVQSDTEKEYVRTLKSLISDFLRGKQEVDRDYYQQIYDWLDGRYVPFSCGHENGKPAEWSGQIEGGTNERKRDSIPCR